MQVEKELMEQIKLGNYVVASKKPTVVSALAAIPKDNGDVRIIHDGSRPEGSGMNSYSIPQSVKFQSVKDACDLAKPNYYMAKVDLQAAYRSVPIHPDDYNTTGLQWTFSDNKNPCYLFDSRLPFGSNKGPGIFHRLSQAIRRSMVRKGFKGTVAYIDDFFITAATYDECNHWLSVLIRLVRKLGFYVSWKKTVGPTQRLTFLGVQIDTTNCSLSLDNDKLSKLHTQLLAFRKRKRASKQQLQSLLGSLSWASNVIRGGRFFLRRVINTMQPLKHQRHKTKLSLDFFKDLQWWISFLSVFNGTAYYSEFVEHVHVDACNLAAGAFWAGNWFYTVFDYDRPAAKNLHINYKEVCAVVSAITTWAKFWQGRSVYIHTDSIVTKAIINKGRSQNAFINALLRQMAWVCAHAHCTIKAVHIPGSLNFLADSISRLHEPTKLSKLFEYLSRWYHGTPPVSTINDHMSVKSLMFLFHRWSLCGARR